MKYIAVSLLITLGLSACGEETLVRDMASLPPADTVVSLEKTDVETMIRHEIRLGILLPLSGPDAAIGKALFNGATLALFDSNDRRLILLPQDTGGTAEGATQAMTRLLAQKPDLIIGPLFSHSITAIKAMAQQAGVNIIGFSSDHTVAGDGVFLMNFPMEAQIERVTRYASDQGYARFASLIPDTDYGKRALEIFDDSLTAEKREFTAVEFYPPDSGLLVEPVKNIARYNERRKRYTGEINFLEKLGEDDDFAQEMLDELKNVETLGDVEFDAILLPEGGAMLTTLAAWVSYYEIDPAKIKILGTGLWDDEMLFLEPQLHGGWFAAPDHEESARFLSRYEESYGQPGPRITTLAYDATALAATLVRQAKFPDFSLERITDESGFSGIDGIFRFSPDGQIERGLAVYEVGRKTFTVIDPAPERFPHREPPAVMIEGMIEGMVTEIESDATDYSEAASPAPLSLNDGRPFPYNPVLPEPLSVPDP